MSQPPNLYEFVMAHLDARRIPQRAVAAGSGVPFSTVCKIAQRSVREPSVHTVQRLADYFASDPQAPQCTCGQAPVASVVPYTGPDRRQDLEPGHLMPKQRDTNHKEAA